MRVKSAPEESAGIPLPRGYEITQHPPPVVIVGSGPVGVRFAQELYRRNALQSAVLYGAEPEEPYNRVRLSSLLAGEIDWRALRSDSSLPPSSVLVRRFGCEVAVIDREAQVVVDARGRAQRYSRLVIATGSTPFVPRIPNVSLAGVYTFRSFHDAQRLLARGACSRRTVVIGAGLLGLEAARAMRRFDTDVLVVDEATRVMHRQLDEEGANRLQRHIEQLGVRLWLGAGVRRIVGDRRVQELELSSGVRIECDTIIIAAGIRPNIGLARDAELSVGRGIRVDDELRTSDPSIFAIGECAEHRGTVYGLAAPGFEQAAVAASIVSGAPARYRGSVAATRLKVVGLSVFSIGRVVDDDVARDARRVVYCSSDAYCKIVTERCKIVGAVAIGEALHLGRLQEAVAQRRLLWPWQVLRFRRLGRLWREAGRGAVHTWPANATVCHCTGVTRGQLSVALADGCATTAALAIATGASTVCGSCTPLINQLCGGDERRRPARGAGMVLGTSAIALLAALLFASSWDLDYAASVQDLASWDFLWRTSAWKQTSGYALLALSALALMMSLRKRVKRLTIGDFGVWRVLHVALGALAFIALLAHTGGRLGAHLDFALSAGFLLLSALGAASGVLIALEHRWRTPRVTLRRRFVWAHILLSWPLPALLGVHVYKSYFF
jgi:nitrite reductase (NADH) large subunit